MPEKFTLGTHEIYVEDIIRNAPPSRLYEEALLFEEGTAIADNGALIAYSGAKTGRSPMDKRIVDHPYSRDDIWWGKINMKIYEETFDINRDRAIDFLNTHDRLYIVDGYVGWDPDCQLKVRLIATRAYHALFLYNMMIRPTREQLKEFGKPDFVIYNAGQFPANKHVRGMTSKTSVNISFERKEMIILGSEYAGEMKKGIFTLMNYLMPKNDKLSMHCSANEGPKGDVSIFFGLSGTGKTTLSADPNRRLIGDDEHCWSEKGVFNIEGGCYAKCINLSAEKEPQIYNAIRFGTVLENVVFDENTHEVDFDDVSITENTRASYPIEYIDNAKIPCTGTHPSNIIFLTCDAFSVLPPVSKLTPEQAMYHFISGYTAKVAGTEVGVTEPIPSFSACFGAPFLVWHPSKYAEILARKMKEHNAKAWLVNTGWSGGPYGVGSRMKLEYTRAIIDAIHDGSLDDVETVEDPIFGLYIPKTCPNVPDEILIPKNTWEDKDKYDQTARKLAKLFNDNFEQFKDNSSEEIIKAGPKI